MRNVVWLCLISTLFINCKSEVKTDVVKDGDHSNFLNHNFELNDEYLQPDTEGIWIQPAQGGKAIAQWGFVDGIRIGIVPSSGPRGLIRIYHPKIVAERMFQFIALEPNKPEATARELSEMDTSPTDSVAGLIFWASNSDMDTVPADYNYPVKATIKKEGNVELMTIYIYAEPFASGIKLKTKIQMRSDNHDEFSISTYSYGKSEVIAHFVPTATMGNFCRLRNLYMRPLKGDTIIKAKNIWPRYKGDWFAASCTAPLMSYPKTLDGMVLVAASNDEEDPSKAEFLKDDWYSFRGTQATQYWKVPEPSDKMLVLVNGRYTYFNSQVPIPGGISYENFEINKPWKEGMTLIFGATLMSPEELILKETGKAWNGD